VVQHPKTTFLAAHDYGMGGIWILIDAESPEQVERLYPQLKVVPQRPTWLDERYMDIMRQRLHFDVDEPSGWLLSLNRTADR
jgi:hypothetical protein